MEGKKLNTMEEKALETLEQNWGRKHDTDNGPVWRVDG